MAEGTFFDYLKEKGLRYPTETVENFLLSLKAKPFVILSGGSGTGKTKLAQAYCEFITEKGTDLYTPLTFEISLDKAENGVAIQHDRYLEIFPEIAPYDRDYYLQIGNVRGKGRVALTPRFFYREKDVIFPEIARLREELKDADRKGKKIKTNVTVEIPAGNGKKNYAIVPVGSNWSESRFITGYRNAITGEYVGTPSLDVMLSAAKDPDIAHFLVLDEMNLSHVERYFSDMLSAMESGEAIELDGNEVSSVKMGKNLFVIGTVNQDETTYSFSPKVLDRANVIEFSSPSPDEIFSSAGSEYSPAGNVAFIQNCMEGIAVRTMSAYDIMKEISAESGNAEPADSMKKCFSDIQRVLEKIGFPMGRRPLDEIMRFMYSAWVYEGKGAFTNWSRYFDAQVLQKLLPKIHGNLGIMDGLKELENICSSAGLNKSAGKISAMIGVLEQQRYVSFTC